MKKWTLNQGIKHIATKDRKMLFMGTLGEKLYAPKSEIKLLKFLSTGLKDEAEIKKWMMSNDHEWTFEHLLQSGFLTEHYIEPNNRNSNDNMFFAVSNQDKDFGNEFRKKTILIFGANGVSSNLIQTFSRMNINEIIVVDNKNVNEWDLNSLIFSSANDINKSRVDSIKENVSTYSSTKITSVTEIISNKTQVEKIANDHKIDFVVISSEIDPRVQKWCYEIFSLNHIPITMCGYSNTIMISGPILDRKNERFESIISVIDEGSSMNYIKFDNTISVTNQILNSFVSSHVASEIYKYWSNINKPESYETRIQIDFVTLGKQKHSLE